MRVAPSFPEKPVRNLRPSRPFCAFSLSKRRRTADLTCKNADIGFTPTENAMSAWHAVAFAVPMIVLHPPKTPCLRGSHSRMLSSHIVLHPPKTPCLRGVCMKLAMSSAVLHPPETPCFHGLNASFAQSQAVLHLPRTPCLRGATRSRDVRCADPQTTSAQRRASAAIARSLLLLPSPPMSRSRGTVKPVAQVSSASEPEGRLAYASRPSGSEADET